MDIGPTVNLELYESILFFLNAEKRTKAKCQDHDVLRMHVFYMDITAGIWEIRGCKSTELESKYFSFANQSFFTTLSCCNTNAVLLCVNKWGKLCSNKTLFMKQKKLNFGSSLFTDCRFDPNTPGMDSIQINFIGSIA